MKIEIERVYSDPSAAHEAALVLQRRGYTSVRVTPWTVPGRAVVGPRVIWWRGTLWHVLPQGTAYGPVLRHVQTGITRIGPRSTFQEVPTCRTFIAR